MKNFLRKSLIDTAHLLEVFAKQLRGAADKVIPEKRLFLLDCEAQNWENVRPCFVLSTGRSGTLLLNNVLAFSPNASPLHEPVPELYRPSRLAYEKISHSPKIFREVFKSAREEYILKAARQDKVYIETNNQCTFFAPVIRDIFPNAIFIHLVRHPGSFVRSGIRRKWYTGEHSHDIGRIVPLNGELKENWETLSLIEKNAWLWNETNKFIEDFKKDLPPESCLYVKAEQLFKDIKITEKIYNFIGLEEFNRKKVAKAIRKPANVQKKGDFPPYKNWPQADKERLKKMAPLAARYNYEL